MAQGGGHRTLLYGHAVLLRHSYSGMVSDTDYIQKHPAKRSFYHESCNIVANKKKKSLSFIPLLRHDV